MTNVVSYWYYFLIAVHDFLHTLVIQVAKFFVFPAFSFIRHFVDFSYIELRSRKLLFESNQTKREPFGCFRMALFIMSSITKRRILPVEQFVNLRLKGQDSYSCQDLICKSSMPIWQKASMKAEAKRALVMSGMLWSMAPRRMR